MLQPLNPLVNSWAARSGLRERALRWTWFEEAFGRAIASTATDPAQPVAIDQPALSKAFFSWAAAVDAQASWEQVDELDFRHFICGLLLQQLLSAQPAVTSGGARPARDTAITCFVLSLLQALRLDAGAQPFDIAAEASTPAWVSSYLENAHDDATSAIAFLDQMTGLQPVWRVPSLIGSRPAMQKALANAEALRTGPG
ncbi:MAG: hypothetical protein Q7T87_01550 [Polaromonas sp.]|nr:hypothetical protein [Polaromonas sp.]